MRKSTLFFLLIAILLQSCYAYKETSASDLKVKKRYIFSLENGQEFEANCTKISDGYAYFDINDNEVKFPVNEITKLERKTVSPVLLIGGIGLATLTGILVIKDNTRERIIE